MESYLFFETLYPEQETRDTPRERLPTYNL